MIDLAKNRERLEQEKKKFQGFEYYEHLEKLLNEKEDDPVFKDYITEYRETKAWLARYNIKGRNTCPQGLTEEEAKIAVGKILHDTEEKMDRLIDLEDAILKLHYQQILKHES